MCKIIILVVVGICKKIFIKMSKVFRMKNFTRLTVVILAVYNNRYQETSPNIKQGQQLANLNYRPSRR